jgi:hypothetical protein
MPGWLIGVLGLAVLVTFVMGLQWILGRAAGALEGAVTGNTRSRGLTATKRRIEFNVPVPGAEIISRITYTLALNEPNPHNLQAAALSDDKASLLIKQASRLQYRIDTEPDQSGCSGSATATQWWESRGRVTTTEVIERIHDHVRSAVRHFGGTYTESLTD